jgi:DNA-binding NtrC family response regulator
VAVNCAAIPALLAERLLFGARKGAYSGADADSAGHLQAADGGTLFLDEIAELSLEVQAKLLRALETGEVQPLGAARPQRVELRLVSATHGDLRAAAAGGRFRDDLYFRIGRPAVALPPLRERAEEIPWLLQAALARAGGELPLHVSLVEAALLRPWPGNARELAGELAAAARRAAAAGAKAVQAGHLAATAGQPLDGAGEAVPASAPREGLSVMEQSERDLIARTLAEQAGNVQATARALGLSRATLYRKIAQYRLDRDKP